VAVPAVAPTDRVAAARALGALVEAHRADMERGGALPEALSDAMADAELFQLFLPASAGGPEVEPLVAFGVGEALARLDGSVGWCSAISSAISSYLGWVGDATIAEMAGPRPRLRLSGSARPLGVAVEVEGGYRVRGHWDFASNVLQSDYYIGTCVFPDQPYADGRERTRAVVIPVADGRVERTWSVMGMRGTGSHDFVAEDVFVPGDRVASVREKRKRTGRIFHTRLTMVVTWAPTVGVGLGIARGALDDFAALAERRSTASEIPLRERREIQLVVGQAEAIVSGARAYVTDAIAQAWAMAADHDEDSPALDAVIAQARLAITHAMNEAVRAVDLLFRASGTNGVFDERRIERRFRDAHVAVQHAAGVPGHIEAAGRVLLGLPAGVPFF